MFNQQELGYKFKNKVLVPIIVAKKFYRDIKVINESKNLFLGSDWP